MAGVKKISIVVVLIALIFFSAFSDACDPCKYKPKPSPRRIPPKGPPANPFCPRDTLKLGVCADLLGELVNVVVGTPASRKCCTLLKGLADLDAAACLCTALKANVLGIEVKLDVALSLLVSACEKSLPPGFKCV